LTYHHKKRKGRGRKVIKDEGSGKFWASGRRAAVYRKGARSCSFGGEEKVTKGGMG